MATLPLFTWRNDDTGRPQARDITISMSRVASPYGNAKAESFMKTLKAEEVNGKAYQSLEDAKGKLGAFIDHVYNARRLHSSIGYKPPLSSKTTSTKLANVRPTRPCPCH